MGSRTGSHIVDLLFTLALFCVFAASALLVVLIGASVYRGTVERSDENFTARTSVTYVATKLRQNDVAGGAHIAPMETGDAQGINALVLEQTLEGEVYQTWIYHHDGYLRETFIRKGAEINPASGQEIVEVAAFSFSQSAASFHISSTDKEGNVTALVVTPRCGIGSVSAQPEAGAIASGSRGDSPGEEDAA